MPDGVAGDVEDIEAAVAEEVVGWVLADLGRRVEGNFANCPASAIACGVNFWTGDGERIRGLLKIRLQHRRILLARVPWHKCFFEAWPYIQLRCLRKQRHIARMIPVEMAPHDAIDLAIVLSSFSQDLVDALPDVQPWDPILDRPLRDRRVIPPVLSATKIEQDCLPQLPVLDKEGEGGQVHVLVALLDGMDESLRRDDDVCCCVDDGDLDGGFRLREIE